MLLRWRQTAVATINNNVSLFSSNDCCICRDIQLKNNETEKIIYNTSVSSLKKEMKYKRKVMQECKKCKLIAHYDHFVCSIESQ